jgi:hypothetical protein
MEKVLITGATGLLGTRLAEMLLAKGYSVNTLGRRGAGSNSVKKGVNTFSWDIDKGQIDEKAFDGVSAIIHLAGAGIADKRWTEARKKEIIDSRVNGAKLIYNSLKKLNSGVKTFISASAVGFYGDCADEVVTEDHKPGKDFLAEVCKKWEAAATRFSDLEIREVRCRFGIVLSEKGGALPQLIQTLPVGIATYFAKDNLYYPWIHLDDVCGILIHALENEKVKGAYNTTAPQPLLMKELMQDIVEAKKAKALLVPTPPFAIKLAMGEMSEMLLCSQRCSAAKITDSGYKFKYGEIRKALKDIFK